MTDLDLDYYYDNGGILMPGYTPPPFPTGLRPDSARPSAKGLQAALKAAGYLGKTVAASDNYGPSTQAAVANFHRLHPAISSVSRSAPGSSPPASPRPTTGASRTAGRRSTSGRASCSRVRVA